MVRESATRAYSLTIIEARDIRKVPSSPALYARLSMSGNKICKTEIKQNSRPTWEHTCPFTAELSSILSLRLKHVRGWFSPVLLGSVNIKTEVLLDRCENDQQTDLTLRDERGQEAGLLVVQLQDLTAQNHQNPANLAATALDGDSVVNLIRRVVDKTKAVVDVVDKSAKLYPYANIAWQVLNSAYHYVVQGRVDRNDRCRVLVEALAALYAFADDADELENKIKVREDIIIPICVQTTECGIFIKQYANRGRTASQSWSNIPGTLSDLSRALERLRVDFNDTVPSHASFISAQTSLNTRRLAGDEALKRLEPAKMDPGTRETCLFGTRQNTLNNLFNYLTDPSLPLGRNVIWLRGPAGSGKSTILNTVAQHFSELRRRGAFLFWNRTDPLNSDPLSVIRTLAFQLAESNPIFATKLAGRITQSPDITASTLDMQFRHLLSEPLAELAKGLNQGPTIIILDALDECGTAESRSELLGTLLAGLTKLPTMFRVLIASRDEPDIRSALSRLKVDIWDVPVGDESTSSDISQFLQQHFAKIVSHCETHNLPPNWPGEQMIKKLVDLANGLFIWASTTIHLIESGNPEEMLEKVMDASADDPSLDTLYRVALTQFFHSSDGNKLNAVRSILGAIVVAREQVTDNQLSQLLGLKLDVVQDILSQLRRFTQWDHGPVQVSHVSCTDFLCHINQRHDMPWDIDESSHHNELAYGCFQIMERELKFNICGIETSYYRNRDIDRICERADEAITPGLAYASRYWADHLESGFTRDSGSPRFVDSVTNFINHRFLYWIEVFSVKGQMSVIPVILSKAASWAGYHKHELQAMISNAQRFVDAFGYPMSQSMPHIYLSALPFAPSGEPILQGMRAMFQNTLSVNQLPVSCQILRGHSGPVWSVAFSHDSTRIVSGSADATIRVWDVMSGAQVGKPLQGHTDGVRSVAFSPDGTRIVSSSDDNNLRIWDAALYVPIGEPLRGHSDSVRSVTFSPDGTRIVSGSWDKTIRIWDAITGASIGESLRGHVDPVWSVAFSPDGTRVISGAFDDTIRIWTVGLRAPISEQMRMTPRDVSTAFSPDGIRIISPHFDKTTRIWDAVSGIPISELLQGDSSLSRSIAISPDRTRIVSGLCDGTIQLLDAMFSVPVGKPPQGRFCTAPWAAHSPNSAPIISGAADDVVAFWDVMSGRPIRKRLGGHFEQIGSVAFSSDGTYIVSCSSDMTIRFWDAASGAPIHRPLQGHSPIVCSVAVSRDGTRIVSGTWDRKLQIWDAASGAPIGAPLEGHARAVQSVAFSADNTRVVSGSHDKTLRIWDAVLGASISEPLRGHYDIITTVAFFHDGTRIISGSDDKTVRIWDVASGAQIGEPLQGHTSTIRSVAPSPDGTRIISGSFDKTIRIWDATSGAQIGKPLHGHTAQVNSVAFSHDGIHIISGSYDKTVRIWDAMSGAPVTVCNPLKGHSSGVWSAAFSPDSTRILSASGDKTIQIWDAMPSAPTDKPLQGQHRAALTTDSTRIVSASESDDKTNQSSLAFTQEANSIHQLRPPVILSSGGNSRSANGEPMFSDSSFLHDDGWVTAYGLLLFWVPPERRRGLLRPSTIAVMGAQPTRLDISRFVYGPQWTQCRTGNH